jgi:hypothetical protein
MPKHITADGGTISGGDLTINDNNLTINDGNITVTADELTWALPYPYAGLVFTLVNSAAGTVDGTQFSVSHENALAAINQLVGLRSTSTVRASTANASMGTVSGFTIGNALYAASGYTGSITSAYGISVAAPSVTGTGTQAITTEQGINVANQGNAAITTSYGIKIENQSGSGTNYSVHTGSGAVVLGDNVTIGSGTAGTDYTLTFNGQSNDGVLTWMEDEDYFQFQDDIIVPAYERHIQIPAFLSGTPADQPTAITIGTAAGLQFGSAANKTVGVQWEVPNDWDGGDVYMDIDWFPDSGAMSGTDTVKWNMSYRSIAEGETITNGTQVDLSVTDSDDYAQYEVKHARFTLDFDNANQPLTKQDHVYFLITRDVSVANDFAGSVVITAFEIIYNSVALPTSN